MNKINIKGSNEKRKRKKEAFLEPAASMSLFLR